MKPVKSVLLFFSLFLQTPLFSQITIVASQTSGCDSLTVGYSYTINPPLAVSSVKWNFGDGKVSTATNPVTKYVIPGAYDVKLVLNGTDSVIYNDFIQVGLTPNLELHYKDTLNPSTNTYVIKAVQTNGNSPFPYSYSWTVDGNVLVDNTSSIVHSFDTTGIFPVAVVATDAQACISSASVDVSVIHGLKVPNVFTPNNDGENDEFKVIYDEINFIQFQLFSKAGLLVYKTKAKKIVWDGKMSSGQDAPAGMYYYIAETTDATPKLTTKGFLYIYR
jgi:gliding motility-associated-like protein